MPDFEINDQTCKDGDIENIMNLTKVDILFLPHMDENGKMKCKMAHSASGVINHQILELEDIDDRINTIKTIKNSQSTEKTEYSPSILSIFDKSNSIGGDYKSASYGNMVLQLTHITDENFLVRDDAFTLQDFMQCDRNRTGKSGVDYDKMRLELIIPQNCNGFDSFELDFNQKMPTKLVEAVIGTTKKDEEVRLEAFEYYLNKYTSYNKTAIDFGALRRESSLQVSETTIDDGMKSAGGKHEEEANSEAGEQENAVIESQITSDFLYSTMDYEDEDDEIEYAVNFDTRRLNRLDEGKREILTLTLNYDSESETSESSTSQSPSGGLNVSEMSSGSDINNTAEEKGDDFSKKINPSTSVKARERNILKYVKSVSNPFQSYRINAKEDSCIEKNKVKEYFLVYKDVFDQESHWQDIASTMVAIIAKSTSDNGLKLGELKRIMEIARISGDIINPLEQMPEDKALTSEEKKLLEDEKSHFRCFVSEVQDLFEKVGIYSTHKSYNDERQGLSLPNLPSEIEDMILDIISNLGDNAESSELEQKVSNDYFDEKQLLTIISGKIAKVDEKLAQEELQETKSRSHSGGSR